MQRGESYYIIIKIKLYRNLTISAIYKAIITKIKKLAKEYNKHINKNQKSNPTLIDKKVFKVVRGLLTHYAIRKAMVKQRAIKDFSDIINSGDKEIFKFNKVVRCLYKCELPLRFSLPYKHGCFYSTYLKGLYLYLSFILNGFQMALRSYSLRRCHC